jgi:hypothetical protein
MFPTKMTRNRYRRRGRKPRCRLREPPHTSDFPSVHSRFSKLSKTHRQLRRETLGGQAARFSGRYRFSGEPFRRFLSGSKDDFNSPTSITFSQEFPLFGAPVRHPIVVPHSQLSHTNCFEQQIFRYLPSVVTDRILIRLLGASDSGLKTLHPPLFPASRNGASNALLLGEIISSVSLNRERK